MKPCDYCGRENEDVGTFCSECGSVLQPPVAPPPTAVAIEPPPFLNPPYDIPPLIPAPSPGPRVLNGGWATAVLGIFLAGQMIGGVIGGFFAGFKAGIQGSPLGGHNYNQAMQDMMPLTILLVMLLGGIALISSGVGFKFQLKDTSPTGAAWVRGSWRNLAIGVSFGMLIALAWAVFTLRLRQPSEEELGPVARMGITAGFARISWVVVALFLAPPVEELLFRGILYGGYRKSMGAVAAAALTTIIFVSLHFTELIYQPLAVFAIGGMALGALALRLRSNAIGPAIAVHFGYNATIATLAILTS
jgi:membrane protease YdiL (CAAX protease family)